MSLYVHIHAPDYVAERCYRHCNTCRKKRLCVVLSYAWYEPLFYCTGCGEDPHSWARRFTRITESRLRKITRAKKILAECVTRENAHTAFQKLIDSEMGVTA